MNTAVAQTQDGPKTQGQSKQKPPAKSSAGRQAPSLTSGPQTTGTSDGPPRSRERHPAETNPGQPPHSSNNGATIAEAAGAGVIASVLIGELIAHHNASPEHFGKEGPKLPKQFDMSSFAVKGLVGPNWPVVVDFILDSPGALRVDIIAADKRRFSATLTNQPNRREYQIFRLPPNFGTKIQRAVFQAQAIPPPGTSGQSPAMRTFGMGAGEKAVGSVAIDQLTFGPATIHPKLKETAAFGFHAHSAFNVVRAEFIYTTLYNGHVFVEQDQEEKLSPIPEGERARGTWEGKGKAGEHMLQVRAWRGLENGGDWVVAWSPDIVQVVK